MQKIIGLDIGSYSVKAVEIINNFKDYKVTNFYEIVVPEIEGVDPSKVGMTAISQLFTENELEYDKIFTAVMGLMASTRILQLQNVKKRQLHAIIPQMLMNQAVIDIDEAILDYQVLSVKGNTTTVLTVLAKKEDISAYLQGLQTVNIEPKILDIDYLSFVNLTNFIKNRYEKSVTGKNQVSYKDKVYAFIDIGHLKTSIIFFKGTQLLAARTIRIAGRHFSEFLQKHLGLSFAEAQRVKHAVSRISLDSQENSDKISEKELVVARCLSVPVLELVREIARTFHAFKTQDGILPEFMILSGGSSVIQGLPALLTRTLQIPLEPLTLDRTKLSIEEDLEDKFPLMTQALAIGFRGLPLKHTSQINLRRGELALAGAYDAIIRQISNFFLLLVVLFVCLVASYMLRWYLYGSQIESLKTNFRKNVQTLSALAPSEPKVLANIAARPKWSLKTYADQTFKLIAEQNRMYEEALAYYAQRKTVLPLRILNRISEVIPKEVEVTDENGNKQKKPLIIDVVLFEVKGSTLSLNADVETREIGEFVSEKISSLPFIVKKDVQQINSPGTNKIRTKIVATIDESKVDDEPFSDEKK